MANLITHIHMGDMVLKALPKELKEIAEANRQAFIYGCIGPDFLFALRETGNKSGRYCNVMQYSKTYEVFSAVASLIRENSEREKLSSDMLSYSLGLICHYVLDSIFHPFVYFFSENGGTSKAVSAVQQMGIHALIESALDEYLLNKNGYIDSNNFNTAKHIQTSRKTKRAISKVYIGAINDLVGFDLSKREVFTAIRLIGIAMRFVTDKWGWKRKLFGRLEEKNQSSGSKKIRNLLRPPEHYGEVDFLNFKKREYRVVRNKPETDNLTAMEIVEKSVAIAQEYIEAFINAVKNGIPLDREKFVVNYEGIYTG